MEHCPSVLLEIFGDGVWQSTAIPVDPISCSHGASAQRTRSRLLAIRPPFLSCCRSPQKRRRQRPLPSPLLSPRPSLCRQRAIIRVHIAGICAAGLSAALKRCSAKISLLRSPGLGPSVRSSQLNSLILSDFDRQRCQK